MPSPDHHDSQMSPDAPDTQVMKARFGLDGLPPRTLEQIGRDFRLTRERVRQIEARALHKLRQPYRNYRVRDFALEQLLVQAGMVTPSPGSVEAAAAAVAEAELESQRDEVALAHERLGTAPAIGIASELRSLLGERERAHARGSIVANAGAKDAGEQRGSSLLDLGLGAGGRRVEDELEDIDVLEEGASKEGVEDSFFEGTGGDIEAELRSLNVAWHKRGGPGGGDAEDERSLVERRALLEEEELLASLDSLEFEDDDFGCDGGGGRDGAEVVMESAKALERLQREMTVNPMSLGERATGPGAGAGAAAPATVTAPSRSLQVA